MTNKPDYELAVYDTAIAIITTIGAVATAPWWWVFREKDNNEKGKTR